MRDGAHQTTTKDGHLWVRLEGTLDEASGARVAAAVWREISELSEGSHVAFDLRGLDGCKLLARAELSGLQQRLAGTKRRTAWLSDRPRYRGLALLICHNAEDPKATVVNTEEQVTEWFASTELRLDAADRVSDRLKSIKAGGASR